MTVPAPATTAPQRYALAEALRQLATRAWSFDLAAAEAPHLLIRLELTLLGSAAACGSIDAR